MSKNLKKWLLYFSVLFLVLLMGYFLFALFGPQRQAHERQIPLSNDANAWERVAYNIERDTISIKKIFNLGEEKVVSDPNPNNYTPQEYVNEVPQTDASVKSIQIRGVLEGWNEDEMVVGVVDKKHVVLIDEPLRVRCVPETLPVYGGGEVSSRMAFIDFSQDDSIGEELELTDIYNLFAVGDDVIVLGEEIVSLGGVIDPSLLVGFGCRLSVPDPLFGGGLND
ncbi:hypothetical protein ACFL1M_03950 [Patescibacteria group bacterium]